MIRYYRDADREDLLECSFCGSYILEGQSHWISETSSLVAAGSLDETGGNLCRFCWTSLAPHPVPRNHLYGD